MPWRIDPEGRKRFITAGALRTETRRLRKKLNRTLSAAEEVDRSRTADPPNRRPSAAVARGEFLTQQERHPGVSLIQGNADADHDR